MRIHVLFTLALTNMLGASNNNNHAATIFLCGSDNTPIPGWKVQLVRSQLNSALFHHFLTSATAQPSAEQAAERLWLSLGNGFSKEQYTALMQTGTPIPAPPAPDREYYRDLRAKGFNHEGFNRDWLKHRLERLKSYYWNDTQQMYAFFLQHHFDQKRALPTEKSDLETYLEIKRTQPRLAGSALAFYNDIEKKLRSAWPTHRLCTDEGLLHTEFFVDLCSGAIPISTSSSPENSPKQLKDAVRTILQVHTWLSHGIALMQEDNPQQTHAELWDIYTQMLAHDPDYKDKTAEEYQEIYKAWRKVIMVYDKKDHEYKRWHREPELKAPDYHVYPLHDLSTLERNCTWGNQNLLSYCSRRFYNRTTDGSLTFDKNDMPIWGDRRSIDTVAMLLTLEALRKSSTCWLRGDGKPFEHVCLATFTLKPGNPMFTVRVSGFSHLRDSIYSNSFIEAQEHGLAHTSTKFDSVDAYSHYQAPPPLWREKEVKDFVTFRLVPTKRCIPQNADAVIADAEADRTLLLALGEIGKVVSADVLTKHLLPFIDLQQPGMDLLPIRACELAATARERAQRAKQLVTTGSSSSELSNRKNTLIASTANTTAIYIALAGYLTQQSKQSFDLNMVEEDAATTAWFTQRMRIWYPQSSAPLLKKFADIYHPFLPKSLVYQVAMQRHLPLESNLQQAASLKARALQRYYPHFESIEELADHAYSFAKQGMMLVPLTQDDSDAWIAHAYDKQLNPTNLFVERLNKYQGLSHLTAEEQQHVTALLMLHNCDRLIMATSQTVGLRNFGHPENEVEEHQLVYVPLFVSPSMRQTACAVGKQFRREHPHLVNATATAVIGAALGLLGIGLKSLEKGAKQPAGLLNAKQ